MKEKTIKLVNRLCEKGNKSCDDGNYEQALHYFLGALKFIPKPIENSSMATWILAAIGDTYFLKNEYQSALNYMNHAVASRDGLGNPFIHFRLGQLNFEIGNTARAKEEFIRVYMVGEMGLFRNSEPKYFDFLRENVNLRESD